jgi:tripartite-type tricarboxylate transporter receptor subunit TctC
LNYASAGSGTGTHLAGELFKTAAQVDIAHVPYKGGGDALTDVIAGRVEITFTGVPAGLPHIKAGKLRALAVTGTQRVRDLPDLPTVAEVLPGFEVAGWNGIFAPVGTPPAIVARIDDEVRKIVASPEMTDRLAVLGAVPMPGTSEQFGRYVRDEIAKWAAVIKAAGVKPD